MMEVGKLLVGASDIVCIGARLLGVGVTGASAIRAEVVGARVTWVLVFGGGGVADAEGYWGTCCRGHCCTSQSEYWSTTDSCSKTKLVCNITM